MSYCRLPSHTGRPVHRQRHAHQARSGCPAHLRAVRSCATERTSGLSTSSSCGTSRIVCRRIGPTSDSPNTPIVPSDRFCRMAAADAAVPPKPPSLPVVQAHSSSRVPTLLHDLPNCSSNCARQGHSHRRHTLSHPCPEPAPAPALAHRNRHGFEEDVRCLTCGTWRPCRSRARTVTRRRVPRRRGGTLPCP